MSLFSSISHIFESHFFNLLFIMVMIWSSGVLFEKIKIPLIVGQLFAGILIGPAVFNIARNTPELDVLAQLGMFFLMFYAGLKTDPKQIRGLIGQSFFIGVMGTLFPFVLGFIVMYHTGGTLLQALFVATAISGTSLVTKTHILDDFNILTTRIGHLMVGSAIFDNIVSFIILAVLAKYAQTGEITIGAGVQTALEVALFFILTIFIGYIIFPRVGKMFSSGKGKGFTFALIMGLLFAVLAELFHLPFIFGAYLAGLFVREEIMSKKLFQTVSDRFLAITHGFLGPLFIMSIAFKVSFNVAWEHPYVLLFVALSVFVGKFTGVALASRLSCFDWKNSCIMGAGMNGRGAVELVFALVGVELGVLNEDHVSILVFVAFITTCMTPFLLQKIMSGSRLSSL